jgi:hypothetical protein
VIVDATAEVGTGMHALAGHLETQGPSPPPWLACEGCWTKERRGVDAVRGSQMGHARGRNPRAALLVGPGGHAPARLARPGMLGSLIGRLRPGVGTGPAHFGEWAMA